jgi:hypothetical protein
MPYKLFFIVLFILLTACVRPELLDDLSTREKTAFQTGQQWMPEIDVNADIAIVYGVQDRPGLSFEERIASWADRGYQTHFMTGIAWGHYKEYFSGEWDGQSHWDAGQVDRSGDTIWHNKGTVPYIVPVDSYIKYFKEEIIAKVIDAGITSIYLEEPEFWARAGYSESFRREWKKYYGSDWKPQHESADNAYLSNKLKYQLYYNAIDQVSGFAKAYGKQKGLDIKVYIPTHSLVNYASWEIVSPEASLASLPGIDGYIAQVWTGTSREPTYYNGILKERVFENAFLEYGSMESMTEPTGRKMFFLTDPIEDWPRDWADYKNNYQATFIAKLLYPQIANYEVMPWPERIYTHKYKLASGSEEALIPRFYSTQMQVMIHALNHMPLSSNKVSGSKGIGVLMSNSLMFQRFPEFEGYSNPQFSNFYGLALPLLKRGIPLKTVHMENLSYSSSLDEIQLLLMSYSNMKPSQEAEHTYIAEWVKGGGVLVYCGKDDDLFQQVSGWWNTDSLDYSVAADHLFDLLDINYSSDKTRYQVGEGVVYLLRENPKDFLETAANDKSYVELIASAYGDDTDVGGLVFKNDFHLTRGNYEIVAVLDENENQNPFVMEGLFIDLFDPEVPVINRKVTGPGEQAFLFNLENFKHENKASVLAAACRIENEIQTKGVYNFRCRAPLNTTNVMRIYLPREPKRVRLKAEGKGTVSCSQIWDQTSKTLFLSFENNPDGLDVQILW